MNTKIKLPLGFVQAELAMNQYCSQKRSSVKEIRSSHNIFYYFR